MNCNCTICSNEFDSDANRAVCPGCRTKIRRVKHKILAIERLGGECKHCGLVFDQHNIAAFEFHHTDPSDKEIAMGRIMNKSLEKVFEEVDKCVLLCSNCHAILHSNITDKFLEEVSKRI